MYLPKSRYNIKNTPGGEFIEKSSRKPYQGPYIETSEGLYYIGNNIINAKRQLIPIDDKPEREFGTSLNVQRHKIVKRKIYDNLKKYKIVPSFKSQPSENDYKKGFYFRFFAKRINSQIGYFEISKDVFGSISDQEEVYDYNLYEVGFIKWALIGNVRKINTQQLKIKDRTFKGIAVLFPTLNEFGRPGIVENQMAEIGELVYRNNPYREYVGPYHIHPDKGPMVGSKHINQPHDLLMFVSDIPRNADGSIRFELDLDKVFESAFQEFLETGDTEYQEAPPSDTTSSTESSDSPSSGEGSGY